MMCNNALLKIVDLSPLFVDTFHVVNRKNNPKIWAVHLRNELDIIWVCGCVNAHGIYFVDKCHAKNTRRQS